jgi:hypothetical protein
VGRQICLTARINRAQRTDLKGTVNDLPQPAKAKSKKKPDEIMKTLRN